MVDYTYKANNILFEDKYVQWAEVGIPAPGSDLLNQGTLYVSGLNTNGQLGLNDRTHRSSPVQVGSFNDWTYLSTVGTGGTTIGIESNGTLWAWGINTNGQLGRDDLTHRSTPVQVGSLNNWKYVHSGVAQSQSSFAIKTDGTLWAWGRNSSWALGLGDQTHRSSPTQVGSLTDWAQVSSFISSALAIKTDGTLWGWGQDSQGKLGLNESSFLYSTPVQVGTLTNWRRLATGSAHVIALKTDGTLWAWGENASGALGLGNTTSVSSPVQVGLLTDWSFISCGGNHSLAVKTDGTLWTWGSNNSGELGLGNSTSRSSPTQVGSLTDWVRVAGGDESAQSSSFSFAVKTDGTLWAWGRNLRGSLGLGNTTNVSSPVQVGTATDWSIGFQSTSGVLALRKRYSYT